MIHFNFYFTMENIDNIKNEIVEKSAAKAIETSNETISAAKAELNETLETKASSESVEKLANDMDKLSEKFESINVGQSKKSPAQEAASFIKSGVDKLREKGSGEFSLNTKDLGIAAGVSPTGIAAYGETMDNMIYYDPHHATRLRNFLPSFSAPEGGAIRFNEESANTGNPTSPKVKGAAGSNSTLTVRPVTRAVETIQTATTIPEEHLTDIAGINTYLNQKLMKIAMDLEDTQIMTGSGTSPQLTGLNTSIAPAAQRLSGQSQIDAYLDNSLEDVVSSINNYDVLNVVAAEMEGRNFKPNLAILNPRDFRALSWIKSSSTQGEYVLTQAMEQGQPAYYWGGLRIVPSAAQTVGDYTILDTNSVGYWLREGVEFRFSYNDDDFISNSITARVKFRSALTGFVPEGVVTGDFAAGRTNMGA